MIFRTNYLCFQPNQRFPSYVGARTIAKRSILDFWKSSRFLSTSASNTAPIHGVLDSTAVLSSFDLYFGFYYPLFYIERFPRNSSPSTSETSEHIGTRSTSVVRLANASTSTNNHSMMTFSVPRLSSIQTTLNYRMTPDSLSIQDVQKDASTTKFELSTHPNSNTNTASISPSRFYK